MRKLFPWSVFRYFQASRMGTTENRVRDPDT